MPVVCYYKPVRTRKREYTVKDLVRISKYVGESTEASKVLGTMAHEYGVEGVLCSIVEIGDTLDMLDDMIAETETLLTAGVTIEVLKTLLTRYGRSIPFIGSYIGVIIGLLEVFERIIAVLVAVKEASDSLGGMSALLKDACDYAKMLSNADSSQLDLPLTVTEEKEDGIK